MTTSQLLYDHALKDFGLSEVAGSKSNPRIQQAIQLAAKWLNPDDSVTAWCGCIMNLWCTELNLATPAEPYRANSWKSVGTSVKLEDAQVGDIVVMDRPGGKHVTLFSRRKGDMVYCLGGNQRNQVNVSGYNVKLVEEVRRPVKKK